MKCNFWLMYLKSPTPKSKFFIKFQITKTNHTSTYYRIIAETPRPLLYLEFEYNSRKIAKNILCYLVKLEYNLRKFI